MKTKIIDAVIERFEIFNPMKARNFSGTSSDIKLFNMQKDFLRTELERLVLDEKELRGIVASGYCTDRNRYKVVDFFLLEDIIKAITDYQISVR